MTSEALVTSPRCTIMEVIDGEPENSTENSSGCCESSDRKQINDNGYTQSVYFTDHIYPSEALRKQNDHRSIYESISLEVF